MSGPQVNCLLSHTWVNKLNMYVWLPVWPLVYLPSVYLPICLPARLSTCSSVCLPVCPSVCLPARLSVSLPALLSVCLSVDPPVRPSVYLLSVSLSTCPSVSQSTCHSVCLSTCPSVCLSTCPSVCLPAILSVCLPAQLSVYLPIYLSVYLPVHPSVRPSVRPSVHLQPCCDVSHVTHNPRYTLPCHRGQWTHESCLVKFPSCRCQYDIDMSVTGITEVSPLTWGWGQSCYNVEVMQTLWCRQR